MRIHEAPQRLTPYFSEAIAARVDVLTRARKMQIPHFVRDGTLPGFSSRCETLPDDKSALPQRL